VKLLQNHFTCYCLLWYPLATAEADDWRAAPCTAWLSDCIAIGWGQRNGGWLAGS